MAAALEYLKSEAEFRQFPAQRFVNFDLIRPTYYISIRPPPTKTLSERHEGVATGGKRGG